MCCASASSSSCSKREPRFRARHSRAGDREGCALPLTPETPVSQLRGVGPARARELSRAGVRTIEDLLFHLPLRYEDRRQVRGVSEIVGEGGHTLVGTLRGLTEVRSARRGLAMVRGWFEDESGSLRVLWFNRPYLRRQVAEGTVYLLHGHVRRRAGNWELINPTCEAAEQALHGGRIVPVYPAIGKLGPIGLRHLMDAVLAELDPSSLGGEPLPARLRDRYRMPTLAAALVAVHRPAAEENVERLNARRSPAHLRLIYGEFLELQVELALLRSGEVRYAKQHGYVMDERLREVLRSLLPFRLTTAQKRVLKEIADDLRSDQPMLRLLQGDVGSGKTIVAALALVIAVENGLQGAFMVPTEILAEQQHRNLARLLGDRYPIALLTGSRRSTALADLLAGRARIAVGTHALIQEGVSFDRLGLAVIDEQHRFGVTQRELLQRKGDRPDVLVMTATPIPRSLALTVYGDLALSVLDELPPGRQPVVTRVVPERERNEVYEWLRHELQAGAQAYIVFPLIEGSQQLQAASIEEMGERVRRYLAPHRSAVVHGRMSSEEREAALTEFADGNLRALVATTVIEVGIDVPSATLMVIDSAERFGLAQLHQLRGRVGRGAAPSTCVALHGALSEEGERRLRVFAETTDGFRIAEADLEIRGPGDLLGTRQSGLPIFRAANIVTDREWLERARSDAHELLAEGSREELLGLLRRLGPEALSRYDRFAGG